MIRLYDYQLDYMSHVRHNWVYDCDTGVGKTVMGIEHYIKYFNGKNLLIVAPACKINEQGWQRHLDENYPYIKYDTCTYNMLSKKYSNYSDWFIIFDECHRIKNSTGVWGKAAYNLSKIACGFILLSATPIPNGWEDSINYFKMFNFIKNKTQFLNNYALTTRIHGYVEVVSWKNIAKLTNMWRQISRRLDKSNAIDLPPLVFKNIYFNVSNTYKRIKKDKIYKNVLYDSQMKLRHGLRLNTNLDKKLEYIKDFVENTQDNIVIFYNYQEEYDLLLKYINKQIYTCNGTIKDYPKKMEWDKIKNTVTLANYKSGSEAVELTYANIIIYFSPTESYTEYYQSYGRCYRNGQKNKVTAYKFITKNTIDVDIYNALNNKQDFNIKIWENDNNLIINS